MSDASTSTSRIRPTAPAFRSLSILHQSRQILAYQSIKLNNTKYLRRIKMRLLVNKVARLPANSGAWMNPLWNRSLKAAKNSWRKKTSWTIKLVRFKMLASILMTSKSWIGRTMPTFGLRMITVRRWQLHLRIVRCDLLKGCSVRQLLPLRPTWKMWTSALKMLIIMQILYASLVLERWK